MKKNLFILALAAVVLGMASCNNNDVNLKRFNITVDEITATSAHIVVTPPDEQLYYVGFPFNIATYNWYKAQPEGVKEALKYFAPGQGTDDLTLNLYPNTKYVLCVGEMNKETSSIVGDVEYAQFQTPAMEAQLPEFIEEGQEYLPMTGSCGFMADKKIVGFDGEYLLPDVGTNTTAPKILMERLGMDLAAAGFATSLYFIFRTIGCLSGSAILRLIPEKVFFAISVCMIIAAMVLLAISNNQLAIYTGIALVGFGNSNIFSICFAQALNHDPEHKNEISGLMIMGLFGGTVFPLCMGVMSDMMGSLGAVLVMAVGAAYLTFFTLKMKK